MLSVIDFLKLWGSLIVAGCSLLVAVISLIKASKTQKIQNQLNSLELLIKQHEFNKLTSEKEMSPFVEAKVMHISKNNWKLRVCNLGNATAFNVVATIEEGAEIRLLDSKMPFEELEAKKSFDVHLLAYMGSPEKFKVKTTWEDENGNKQEKTQLVSL